MTCEICDTLKESKEWNKPWSDDTPSRPDAFLKLVYIGRKNNYHLYKCQICSQVYEEISRNELFSEGLTEFSKL